MEETKREIIERLKSILAGVATGGKIEPHINLDYKRVRSAALKDPDVKKRLPDFVKANGELIEFWSFIKEKFGTYAERRNFLRDQFNPLLDYLTEMDASPVVSTITESLTAFTEAELHSVWISTVQLRRPDLSSKPPQSIFLAV